MASQMYGVTGQRKMKRNQGAELNARLQLLPSIIAAKQDKEQLAADTKFKNKSLRQEKNIAKKTSKFQKKQSKQAFGMEAGKLGLNLATSDLLQDGGTQIGNIMNKFKSTPAPAPNGPPAKIQGQKQGYFSGLSIGGGLAGGLGGYGAASMYGGGKTKKMLIGAGAGGLMGLLGGGNGLSGALGGLFGGMIA